MNEVQIRPRTLARATPGPLRALLAGLRICTALALAVLALQAAAGTVVFPAYGQPVLNVPANISIGRDTAVATNLWNQMKNAGLAISDVACTIQKDVTVNGALVPGYSNVYQTGVQGIGVRFYITSGYNGQLVAVPVSQTFSRQNGTVEHDVRADFVVTGPVSSGVTQDLPTMQVRFSGTCFTTVDATQQLTGSTSVTSNTCSVTTPALDFQLPRAYARNLANLGDTTGDTVLQLGLNCPAGIKVGITITDAVIPANRSTALSLSSNSSASGVGMQILRGGTPIAFGPDSAAANTVNQWSAGISAGGALQVPLTARYVRTSGALMPGSVNGKATFTMSYQ
jgi:type 1 fimbria pilin